MVAARLVLLPSYSATRTPSPVQVCPGGQPVPAAMPHYATPRHARPCRAVLRWELFLTPHFFFAVRLSLSLPYGQPAVDVASSRSVALR